MSSDIKTATLDIRGQICPSTLLIALKEINRLKNQLKNAELELMILTDNRDAVATIPDAAITMGYTSNIEKAEEGFYKITIKKSPIKRL